MSDDECGECHGKYNSKEKQPIKLLCNCILCLQCINYFKDTFPSGEFECDNCCKNTRSTNIVVKKLIPQDNEIDSSNSTNLTQNSTNEEFEIFVNLMNNVKFSMKVTKDTTIGQIKLKIQEEKGHDKDRIKLGYTKIFEDDDQKTLEYYNITKTVTINQYYTQMGGLPMK